MKPETTHRASTVLFDLDGTLIDTAPDFIRCLNQLREQHGLPALPHEHIRRSVSNGARAMIRVGFGLEPEHPEYLEKHTAFLDLYEAGVAVETSLFEGMDELLKALEEQGIPWGIVTNKPHAMTQPLLKALGLLHRSGCVVSGDRLPQRKPDPAPLRLGAQELGVPPERCVYVGDAPRDIDAGRAAGMATIAASYGYIRSNDDPHSWGASVVIRRPTELLEALDQLQ